MAISKEAQRNHDALFPDHVTNRISVKAARSGTGGRPPFGLRRRIGSSGAIRAHNLPPTNAAVNASLPQRRDLTSSFWLRCC
jgi:hypothetical protein